MEWTGSLDNIVTLAIVIFSVIYTFIVRHKTKAEADVKCEDVYTELDNVRLTIRKILEDQNRLKKEKK